MVGLDEMEIRGVEMREPRERGRIVDRQAPAAQGDQPHAAQFLERGAKALSVKPGRIGITEAGKVTALARAQGANVCSGMYAESALGTLISLQLSAALKDPLVTAEQSFFLIMRDHVVRGDVTVKDGRVALPATADYAGLVDWDKVKRYGFAV